MKSEGKMSFSVLLLNWLNFAMEKFLFNQLPILKFTLKEVLCPSAMNLG